MSFPDRRWNNKSMDVLKRLLNGIRKNMYINTSDLKKIKEGDKDWLPGGTLLMVWDKMSYFVIQKNTIGKYGQISSIILQNDKKVLELITFYRIVDSIEEGI